MLVGSGPLLAEPGPKSSDLRHVWVNRCWPNSAEFGPNLTDSGPDLVDSGEHIWPNFVDIVPYSAGSKRNR